MSVIFESIRFMPEKYDRGSIVFFRPILREENNPTDPKYGNDTLPSEEPELRIVSALFLPVPSRWRFLSELSFAMVRVELGEFVT